MTFEAQHVSVAIERPPAEVYAFASQPRNLPRWARGLSKGIEFVDGAWVADSPLGRVEVRMAVPNRFGVLDHDVVLPLGGTVSNPMRVLANDAGSEVVFTLYRRPGVSDAALAEDAATVLEDLKRLKGLLEAPTAPARGR